MRTPFTLADLKKTPCAAINQHLFVAPVKKKEKSLGKQKTWIQFRLLQFAESNKLELKEEHRFHDERKWRFDWAIPELHIAFEYEGIFSAKSRHTTAKGFTGDAEKYNAAQSAGWIVYRYTAINYLDLVTDLNNLPGIIQKEKDLFK
jgi:hypothetical protein